MDGKFRLRSFWQLLISHEIHFTSLYFHFSQKHKNFFSRNVQGWKSFGDFGRFWALFVRIFWSWKGQVRFQWPFQVVRFFSKSESLRFQATERISPLVCWEVWGTFEFRFTALKYSWRIFLPLRPIWKPFSWCCVSTAEQTVMYTCLREKCGKAFTWVTNYPTKRMWERKIIISFFWVKTGGMVDFQELCPGGRNPTFLAFFLEIPPT